MVESIHVVQTDRLRTIFHEMLKSDKLPDADKKLSICGRKGRMFLVLGLIPGICAYHIDLLPSCRSVQRGVAERRIEGC